MIQPKRIHLLGALVALTVTSCKKLDVATLAATPQVKVAEVIARDVPIYVEAIGQTRGNKEIEISARVEGFVESMDFQEGSFVKKGQLLYTIDDRPFKASLSQSKAKLAESQAQLARAHQDVARYEPLVAKNAVSRQDYETAVAIEQAQRSAVAAAQAGMERSEIELGYTRVLAPDDGLIGVSEVHPGTLAGRGDNLLLTRISKVDPIHVRFSIAERDYLHFARQREANAGTPGASMPFQLVLADGSVHAPPGKLVFVDRNVDSTTGTILLEAAFPNPGGIIRPGQYARVRAMVDTKKGALLVSQRSVQELQGVYSLAVVKPDDTVEVRPVQPAERIGALWVIDKGLNAGERVVVEGLQKVRPGVKVQPQVVALEDSEKNGSAAAPGR